MHFIYCRMLKGIEYWENKGAVRQQFSSSLINIQSLWKLKKHWTFNYNSNTFKHHSNTSNRKFISAEIPFIFNFIMNYVWIIFILFIWVCILFDSMPYFHYILSMQSFYLSTFMLVILPVILAFIWFSYSYHSFSISYSYYLSG